MCRSSKRSQLTQLLILTLAFIQIKEQESKPPSKFLVACNITLDNIKDIDRVLHVATCDSRSGPKGFNAMRAWNISGIQLGAEGISMKNVCKGVDWGKNGFLTKPMMYVNYLHQILNNSRDISKEHVLLMDSDTFWSSTSVSHIWRNFDCARGNKDVVVATEMQCWVGRYCTPVDLEQFYNSSKVTDSYSMFLNSGVIMGNASKILRMLEHIVEHNESYFITFRKHKFDDQYAFVNYILKSHPTEFALDYHQYISASFSTHTAMYPASENFPFVCKSMKDGEIWPSCADSTMQLARKGAFAMNSSTCILTREAPESAPLFPVIRQLAPEPVLWHGNGAGKRSFWYYSGQVFDCYLRIRNITKDEFLNAGMYSY